MSKILFLALVAAAACNGGARVQIGGRVSSAESALVAADAVAATARVTHVMAVTTSSQNAERVVAKIGADGSFDLEVDPARPWALVFIDATRVGADMIVGVFKAQALDSLPPAKTAGKVDLGNVKIAGGVAGSDVGYAQLLAALGIDPATAEDLGAVDDLCLRYVNPDIDGDGVIDAEEPGHTFGLDFHTHFALQAKGHAATVGDLVGDYLPDDTSISYGGAGIYVSYPAAFAGRSVARGVTFDDPVTVTTFAPSGWATVTYPAGAEVPEGGLITNDYGDYHSFGVYGGAGHDLPQGTYRFRVGTTTLTFAHVRTHSDAELSAAKNFILPFIRFVPTDATCKSACTIAAIDYTWRKRTDAGWVTATEAELSFVTADEGGYISLRNHTDDADATVGFVIPSTSPTGTLKWAPAGANLANLGAAAMSAMTTDDVCHLGLSYDDKLGMRFFGGIANQPGTCGQP